LLDEKFVVLQGKFESRNEQAEYENRALKKGWEIWMGGPNCVTADTGQPSTVFCQSIH
jgi:hypothetical protein